MIDNSPHRTPPLNYNTNTNVLSICRALWRILWAKNGEFSKQKYILVQSSNHGCEHTKQQRSCKFSIFSVEEEDCPLSCMMLAGDFCLSAVEW